MQLNKIKHADMVKRLAKPGDVIKSELTVLDCHLLHMSMGLTGEVGELVDAIKKSLFYRKELDLENVIEELGDIEFYLEGLRESLNISRQQTIDANIAKLGVRYKGHNYSDKQAHDRADKA